MASTGRKMARGYICIQKKTVFFQNFWVGSRRCSQYLLCKWDLSVEWLTSRNLIYSNTLSLVHVILCALHTYLCKFESDSCGWNYRWLPGFRDYLIFATTQVSQNLNLVAIPTTSEKTKKLVQGTTVIITHKKKKKWKKETCAGNSYH